MFGKKIKQAVFASALLCLSTSIIAAEEAPSFAQLMAYGQFQQADALAQAELSKQLDKKQFDSLALQQTYFDAADAASLFGRWQQALMLLQQLEQGLLQAQVTEPVVWLELYSRQLALYGEIADYRRADALYQKAENLVRANQLQKQPAWYALLDTWADLLKQQQRWGALLETRVHQWAWQQGVLELPAELQALEQVALLSSMGEARYHLGSDGTALFRQAEALLDGLYQKGEVDQLAVLQHMLLWTQLAGQQISVKWQECQLNQELQQIIEQRDGKNSWLMIEPLMQQAASCSEQPAEQEALLQRAFKLAQQNWEMPHPQTLAVLRQWQTLLPSAFKPGSKWLLQLSQQQQQLYAAFAMPPVRDALKQLEQQRTTECIQFATGNCRATLETKLQQLSQAWGLSHPALLNLRVNLAASLLDYVDHPGSTKDQQAREQFASDLCDSSLLNAKALSEPLFSAQVAMRCGQLNEMRGLYSIAEAQLERAEQQYRAYLGADDRATRQLNNRLNRLRLLLKKTK